MGRRKTETEEQKKIATTRPWPGAGKVQKEKHEAIQSTIPNPRFWVGFPFRMDFKGNLLCGGAPKQEDVIATWQSTRKATDTRYKTMQATGIGPNSRQPRPMEEMTRARLETLVIPLENESGEDGQALGDRTSIGFDHDTIGLFIPSTNVRAHLKDAADRMNKAMTSEDKSVRIVLGPRVFAFGLRTRDYLYVIGDGQSKDREDRIHILDQEGNVVQEPTDNYQMTMNVRNPRGGPDMTCLKRVDCVADAVLQGTITLFRFGSITREHLVSMFEFGKLAGFGQDRGMQRGRYEYWLGESMES